MFPSCLTYPSRTVGPFKDTTLIAAHEGEDWTCEHDACRSPQCSITNVKASGSSSGQPTICRWPLWPGRRWDYFLWAGLYYDICHPCVCGLRDLAPTSGAIRAYAARVDAGYLVVALVIMVIFNAIFRGMKVQLLECTPTQTWPARECAGPSVDNRYGAKCR